MIKSILGKYVQQRMKTIVFILTFAFLFLSSMPVFAVIMPWNKEGKLVKLEYGIFWAHHAIELPDGNIAFPPDYILNTKTYKLEKTDKKYFSGIKLKDGTILTAEPIYEHIFNSKFMGKLYNYLKNEKHIDAYKKYPNLVKLSRREQLNFFLSNLAGTPIMNDYNTYKDKYEKSMYGIISNPETGEYAYVGKLYLRRTNTEQFLTQNGDVIITGGYIDWDNSISEEKNIKMQNEARNSIEIYNSKTKNFSLIKPDKNNSACCGTPIGITNDDKLLITKGKKYFFYDAKTNKYSEKKPFLLGLKRGGTIKLQDGRFLIFTSPLKYASGYENIKNYGDIIDYNNLEKYKNGHKNIRANNSFKDIIIYNPEDDSFKYGGSMAVERGNQAACPFGTALLKDDRVLIYGGVGVEPELIGKAKEIYSIEIYNPNTGKSKIIGNASRTSSFGKECAYCKGKSLLLSDGRVLIYNYGTLADGRIFIENELLMYIPKNYILNN